MQRMNAQEPKSQYDVTNLSDPLQILLVGQDKLFSEQVCDSLTQVGHTVHLQRNGAFLLKSLATQILDLLLLDLDLPGFAAIEFCVELRKKSRIPLIFFGLSYQTERLIKIFEAGADDVITQPCTLKEIEARIAAVLRRSKGSYVPTGIGEIGVPAIPLEEVRRQMIVEHQLLDLTPIAGRLLSFFLAHLNQIVSKEEIYKAVWNHEVCGVSNVVEVAIRRLREKIENDPSAPQYLLTVRSVGYKFVLPGYE